MIDNRILGAMAIALAGILLGFTTGRLSAWLVPPTGMASVGSTAKPSVPLKSAEPAKQPARTPEDTAGAAAGSPAKPTSADAGKSADAPAESARIEPKPAPGNGKPAPADVTSRALSPGEPQGGTAWTDADTKLINPRSTQRPERPQERPTPFGPSTRFSEGPAEQMRTLTSSPDGLERCRQKYRSFDPSDGTYKPYGQDARVPCPHLSR